MRGLGPDAGARDAARVLRLVGTHHVRADRPVRCLYPVGGEPVRHSFEELFRAFAPYTRERTADRERKRRPGRPLGGLRLAAHDGRCTSSGPWALWARRLDDFQALRALRWWQPLRPGHRDQWLFLAACALAWMVPAGLVRREVLDLGREALGGGWSERELETTMGTTLRRAEAAGRGEMIEWPLGSGELVDPRYRVRDRTIIDRLEITDEELALLPPGGQLGPQSLEVRRAARRRLGGRSERRCTQDRAGASRRLHRASEGRGGPLSAADRGPGGDEPCRGRESVGAVGRLRVVTELYVLWAEPAAEPQA